MNNNMDLEYLSFNELDDSDELTEEVTASLMSMMRTKYEYGPAAMEIDEDLTREFSYDETDSSEKQINENSNEEENANSELDNKSKIKKIVNTLVKNLKFKKKKKKKCIP